MEKSRITFSEKCVHLFSSIVIIANGISGLCKENVVSEKGG